VDEESEPGIALEGGSASAVGSLNAGLAGSHGKQPAAPVPVGGDVKTARLISSVPPAYPQLARSQRLSGDVKLDALIDENGRVTATKVFSGPVLLHQAAIDALRQWKYQPATLDGKPVPMHLTVTIQFRLQ
jgi:protein TonB